MVEAAERRRRVLTMASKFRYVDDVIRAKSIVDSGILGEIVCSRTSSRRASTWRERWNAEPAISGGGVLIDNGTHSVDIMRYFLGPLAEVQAVEGKRVQDLPSRTPCRIFVRTADGVLGTIDLSWSINKELDSYLTVYGSHGTRPVGWKESQVPPGVEPRLGRLRQRLRQGRGVPQPARQLRRRDPRPRSRC